MVKALSSIPRTSEVGSSREFGFVVLGTGKFRNMALASAWLLKGLVLLQLMEESRNGHVFKRENWKGGLDV